MRIVGELNIGARRRTGSSTISLSLKIAIGVVALIIGGGLALLFFAWTGIYNVAASRGHFAITSWLLEVGMRNSVKTHSIGLAAPQLDNENMVRLGAGVYTGGCEMCHGAPGKTPDPLFQKMLPAPPDLSQRVPMWENKHLFWIVKHGIKYAGMPEWVSQERDDEVWSVAAFLRKLPEMDPSTYRQMSQGNIGDKASDPAMLVTSGGSPTQLTACARCHDTETAPPVSRLVPKLAGLTQDYLEQSLRHYKSGARTSGVMQPIASALGEDDFALLASYFAKLPSKSGTVAPQAKPDAIGRGQVIAEQGLPASGVPPCASCHSGGAHRTYPKLAGQHADYVTGQLRLWRRGVRAGTAEGAIMAPVARALSEAQVDDVAAYYESLPPGRDEALR